MKVLELFAGTRCISKAFERAGHETYSVEWDRNFEIVDGVETLTFKLRSGAGVRFIATEVA